MADGYKELTLRIYQTYATTALVDDLSQLLVSKYGVTEVIKRSKRAASIPAADAVIKELSEKCDLVITGSGD